MSNLKSYISSILNSYDFNFNFIMGNGNYCKFTHYDHGEMKIAKQSVKQSHFSNTKMGLENLQFSIRPSGNDNVKLINIRSIQFTTHRT
jgi:hypothetical protein